MMDIVKQLRKLSADNPSPRDCIDYAADEIERLRAEVQHWKANHDNRVEAARVLIERHDLPFDRIPAYKHYLHMQEDVAALRAEVDALKVENESLRDGWGAKEALRQKLRDTEDFLNAVATACETAEKSLIERTAEVDALRQILRDAYEVWAGSEGIPEPVYASEAYLYHLLVSMRDEVKRGLQRKGNDK